MLLAHRRQKMARDRPGPAPFGFFTLRYTPVGARIRYSHQQVEERQRANACIDSDQNTGKSETIGGLFRTHLDLTEVEKLI
jgi:hypothetical protein